MNVIDPLASWPVFDEEQVLIAGEILRSGKVNYWTGDQGKAFEAEFAQFHEVDHAIALANGTLALELALIALGVGEGDEVIVTPRSYFASVSAVMMVGATPVFADVHPNSQNLTVESISERISDRTRAIIPVHLAGWPCDMPNIMRLAEQHDLFVIEDCAQAHGATVDGRKVGSFGDAAAFSFCQDKIMTTAGEGGMLLLKDELVWERAWAFKDHGKSFRAVHREDHPLGFRWLHESVGTNWRLTELQSGIGRWQLKKLPEWLRVRNANASDLTACFSDFDCVRVPRPENSVGHANYKFYMFVEPAALRDGFDRDRILQEFSYRGVPALSGSCPEIYREKALSDLSVASMDVARTLGETSIMLPVHPTLTAKNRQQIKEAVCEVLAIASS